MSLNAGQQTRCVHLDPKMTGITELPLSSNKALQTTPYDITSEGFARPEMRRTGRPVSGLVGPRMGASHNAPRGRVHELLDNQYHLNGYMPHVQSSRRVEITAHLPNGLNR